MNDLNYFDFFWICLVTTFLDLTFFLDFNLTFFLGSLFFEFGLCVILLGNFLIFFFVNLGLMVLSNVSGSLGEDLRVVGGTNLI